jgi:pyruvate/2-oxoglutarate dehydrogenase complex dihydrolipoamide dehydrogenase (E3) component
MKQIGSILLKGLVTILPIGVTIYFIYWLGVTTEELLSKPIKLVIDDDRGVIVGATSAGPTGGETLSALAFAVRAEIPVATLKNTIYAYPTFYRAIETAL